MAKVIQQFLLRPRGVVHSEPLPSGAVIVRMGMWEASPYAWVWLDPEAPRDWLVDFLIVGTGDLVEEETFWPVCAFADGAATIWTGLYRWRQQIIPLLHQHTHG